MDISPPTCALYTPQAPTAGFGPSVSSSHASIHDGPDTRALPVRLPRARHGQAASPGTVLAHDYGQYKTASNIVTGASWMPAPPARVPELMPQWADQAEWQTANLDDEALLEAIASAHVAFERIHPFGDGNGRTGRAVIAYQTIRRFGFPAVIQVTARSGYIAMLDSQDIPALTRLLATALADETSRYTPR